MLRLKVMLLFIGCFIGGICMSQQQSLCERPVLKCLTSDVVVCENYEKLDEFSCALKFVREKDRDKIEYIRRIFEVSETIEDECFIKNDLVHYQYKFSKFSQYPVDYNELETFAKEGNSGAAYVLIFSDEYSNKSKETMKNSLYWSLVYFSKYNHKLSDYEEARKKREGLYLILNGDEIGEVVERYLMDSNVLNDC